MSKTRTLFEVDGPVSPEQTVDRQHAGRHDQGMRRGGRPLAPVETLSSGWGFNIRAVIGGLTVGQRTVFRALAECGTPMVAPPLRMLGLAKTTAQEATPRLLAAGLIEEAKRDWRVVDPMLELWIRNNDRTRV